MDREVVETYKSMERFFIKAPYHLVHRILILRWLCYLCYQVGFIQRRPYLRRWIGREIGNTSDRECASVSGSLGFHSVQVPGIDSCL